MHNDNTPNDHASDNARRQQEQAEKAQAEQQLRKQEEADKRS